MPLLNPNLFLVGVASVVIPIAIHILMRRRRKPVAWAAMKFLEQAYRQQRKRTKLEQLLLLATRCLLVAALALAIGRPMLRTAGFFDAAGPRTMILVIDNSIASGVAEGAGIELDSLKKQAEGLIQGLSVTRGDQVAVIASASPTEPVVLPPSADLGGVIEAIRRIQPTESAADLVAASAKVRELTASPSLAGTPSVVFLSAWRSGSADISRPLAPLDAGDRARIAASEPVSRAVTNVTVLDVSASRSVLIAPETETGAVPASVRIALRRTGALAASTTPIEVRAIGVSGGVSPVVTVPVAWQAGQASATVSANIEIPAALVRQGPALALSALVAGDQLPGDNAFAKPIVSRRQLRVVVLAQRSTSAAATPDAFTSADWLGLALAPAASALDRRSAEIDVSVVDPTTPGASSDVMGAEAVFVAAPDRVDESTLQSLRKSLDAGRLIVLMPPAKSGAAAWPARFVAAMDLPWSFAAEVRVLPAERPLTTPTGADSGIFAMLGPELADLVKPVRVSRVLPATPRADGGRVLLALDDGTPFLVSSMRGQGMAVYLASAPELDWTNLPAMPLMLPLVQEVLRQGLGEAVGTSSLIAGRDATWPVGVDQFRGIATPWRAEPGAEPRPPRSPANAGLFRTVDGGGRTLGLLAVNADPDGGRVDPIAKPELERWLNGLANGKLVWLGTGDASPGTQAERAVAHEEQLTPWDLILLAIAVGLGVVELALARWFSHATVAGKSPGLSSALPTGGGIVPAHAGGAKGAG